MKHITHIFHIINTCCLLFFCCCCLWAEDDLTEAEMDSLAMKFYSWEKGDDDSSLNLHNSSMNMQKTLESFMQSHEYSITQDLNNQTYIGKILIIVKENVYTSISSYVIRYAHDIHNAYGCGVDVVSVNGENAQEIKGIINSYSTDLNGAVLIGDIAYINYYHPDSIVRGDTLWKAELFPCDLYYMDFNGSWTLRSGSADSLVAHYGGAGDVEPEIFVGRINTATMGRAELQELMFFFDRDHQYWTGKKVLNKQRAVTFTGKDWDEWWREFRGGVSPLYGNDYYDAVYGSNTFTKVNYSTYLQNSTYEFVQLACHSNVHVHNFQTTSDSLMDYNAICALDKKQIGYNLFCCKACKWTTDYFSPCLGESYLYGVNNNSSALALVGSTKTGGMLGLKKFYNPLGDGKCIGQAFKKWWIDKWGSNHDNYAIHWSYGMVILGDPLVDFNFTNDCDDILYLNDGEETTNNMYYAQSKIVIQDYSLTQGQSVTLSAPTIQITGPFVCNLGSTLTATTLDSCVCNTPRNSQSGSSNRLPVRPKKVSNIVYSIYPNPVTDVLIVDAEEQLNHISIYNQSGQCVLQTGETQINVSHLPLGLYVLRATTVEGNIIQSKIIHK